MAMTSVLIKYKLDRRRWRRRHQFKDSFCSYINAPPSPLLSALLPPGLFIKDVVGYFGGRRTWVGIFLNGNLCAIRVMWHSSERSLMLKNCKLFLSVPFLSVSKMKRRRWRDVGMFSEGRRGGVLVWSCCGSMKFVIVFKCSRNS